MHGTADKVLPNYKSADILIENGGHFMVVNEAERVSFELKKVIFSENLPYGEAGTEGLF